MENKSADINDLVISLATIGTRPLFSDEIWQYYGYKKKPSHGLIWDKIFPKIFALDNFISKEILTMGLIDVLNSIKKSNVDHDTKLILSVGVVDQFLSVTKNMYSANSFMELLLSSYGAYLKSEKTRKQDFFILKSKEILDNKGFARILVGSSKLFSHNDTADFLIKSDYIKDTVEKSSKENTVRISMTDEIYKKYVPLLEERILNA